MIFGKLNKEQIDAVKQEGMVLLTACPGSGKTRVIIHKLAYELSQLDESSKQRIVALTFTNRAAEEIFRRLNAMGIRSNKVWTGTLHSFCLEWIIKPYSCYLSELKNGYSIADETYCSELIDSLKGKHGLGTFDKVNTRLNRDGSFVESKIAQQNLLKEYHKILSQRRFIDFELILYYSHKILSKHRKIQKTLSNLFKLICVDEYQDTQDLLYAIISAIVKIGEGKTSMFLVGDVDQAIYTSLGGVAKNISQISSEIGDLPITPLTLSGNYRSSQRIIDFYTHFQSERIEITAVGKNAREQGLITFNDSIDQGDLVEEIARLIQLSLDKNIPEDEICVLVPQWWLITSVSKKLRVLLPAVNFDASGLAPMARNRDNIWYKLSRLFLTEPSPRIYSLRYRWADELISNFRLLTNVEFNEEFRSERELLRLINSIKSREMEGIDYLNDCFDQFLEMVGIDESFFPLLQENRKLFFQTIEKRLNDPDIEIPSDIQSFKNFYKEMTGVVINSCVGVKGEEFETVIAYGLLHGYIPHWDEIFAGDQVAASKKLMYVICSRAKSNLHLISELGRKTKKGVPLETNHELREIVFDYDEL